MCGRSGSASRATAMPSTAGGLCSGASGASSSSRAINASSTSVGRYRSGPPCTTRWPTATKPEGLQRLPGFGELLERLLQRGAVVGDRPVADPLDDSVGHHRTRIRFDDSVFQRRRAGVDHQHRARARPSLALCLDRGDRHGIDDVLDQRAPRQVVDRLVQSLQHRARSRWRRRCAVRPCRCCCRC